MKQAIDIIILHYTKVGDKSLVLHTLSREYGRRSFIVAVPKGGSMALFQPLNVLSVELTENSKTDLWRLGGISAKYPLNGIRDSVVKNTIALFMSEVLYRTVKDGAMEDGLYEWCLKSILTLESLEYGYNNYHLRFLLELCSSLGFQPSVQNIAPFCGDCLQEVSQLLSLSLADSLVLPLSGQKRSQIAQSVLAYLSEHTESRIEVKSLNVLHEIFVF